MSLDDVKNAIDIINGKSDDSDFDEPKDEALIKSSEQTLGFDFQ